MFLILASQLERVGFLIAMLFFLLRLPKLRQFMQFRGERRNLWIFILLFSFFAVLGTYSGVRVTGDGYSPNRGQRIFQVLMPSRRIERLGSSSLVYLAG